MRKVKNKLIIFVLICFAVCFIGCSEQQRPESDASSSVIDEALMEQNYSNDENYSIWASLKDLAFPEDYYCEYTVSRYSSGSDSSERIRLIKNGERFWAAIDRGSITHQTYYGAGDGKLVITDRIENKASEYESLGEFDIEHELGIISAQEIANALAEFIVYGQAENDYGKIIGVETLMLSSSSRNVADVFFYYQGQDTYDEYLIDLELGVVIVADSFYKGEVTYSVALDNFMDNETADIASIFDIYVLMNQ